MRINGGARAAIRLGAVAMAVVWAVPAMGQAREEIGLTIYEGGFALVSEQREAALGAGRTTLRVGGLPSGIQSDTAVVVFPRGSGVRLMGQRLRMPTDSPLERFVGRKVKVIRAHPTSGAEIVDDATLLSAPPRMALDMGDRIEIAPPGRIALPGLTDDVAFEPILILDAAAERPTTIRYRLTYLAEGLGWAADYALHLDAEGKRGALQGRATLTNSSGRSFRGAVARLVSGSVNRVAPAPMPAGGAKRSAAIAFSQALPEAGAAESVAEVEVYDLPGSHDFADGEQTKIVLLDSREIAVNRSYELTTSLINPARGTRREGDTSHPIARVSFDNTAIQGLGLPLPRGVVRLYGGRGLFLGEDRMRHTAAGGTVSLTMGQTVDITAVRKRTDYRTEGLPKGTSEMAYEVALQNAKQEAVTVELVDILPGDWQILSESAPHEKATDRHAVWRLDVPAGGSATLAYRARVRMQ